MAVHKERIDRLEMLVRLIPVHLPAEHCPDPGRLLDSVAEYYAHHASQSSRRRAIQRDLEELVRDERIQVVNPGGKPLRFRRCLDSDAADPRVWEYTRSLMHALIREALPEGRLERIWSRLRQESEGLGLGEDKLYFLSDTQRLLPADIREDVLVAALEALSLGLSLHVSYRDAANKLSHPVLHPQALLQRGPRVYLFALKNDETTPVRMYALHRVLRASLGQQPAQVAAGFDLQDKIRQGHADFGAGRQLDLILRVRGYVAGLLRDCPLSKNQRIEDEPEGSPFELRICATLPGTGQLFRWLLGCGDNVEVLAPIDLREALGTQAAKTAALYAPTPA